MPNSARDDGHHVMHSACLLMMAYTYDVYKGSMAGCIIGFPGEGGRP